MKTLSIAVDIYDEFIETGSYYTKQNLRELMAYIRSAGATDVEWIVDDVWSIYDEGGYPMGFDLLQAAVDAAHEHDLKFVAVYKPFEGALTGLIVPHTMPATDKPILWDDLQGYVPIIRPFAVEHPEMCLKRRPSDVDPGGNVREIRLVKSDDKPIDLDASKITIWTSERNGRMEQYDGSFDVKVSQGWRPLFPLGATCTIVTITGLNIPASQKYVDVRLEPGALEEAEFRNDYDMLLEAVNDRGQTIPLTIAAAEHPRAAYAERLAQHPYNTMIRYARLPEVQAFVEDKAKLADASRDFGAYGREVHDRTYSLEKRMQAAFARGKQPYVRGILNPVYPEVRESWLKTVAFCLDRNVDAVNIRTGSHLNQQEIWAYGFNQPVLEQMGGEENIAEACRIMGDAFTQFTNDAAELVHSRGKQFGIHLLTNFLRQRDEGMARPNHEIMDWQWEKWLPVADFAVLRGAMGMRPESLHFTVDAFAWACRQHDVPLIYQSNRRAYVGRLDELHLHPDRLKALEHEMAYAWNHPGVSGFQYYETANFTKLDERETLIGSQEMVELSRKFGLVK